MATRKKTELLPRPLVQVIQEFNRQKIHFLIAGARALAFYGYPRYTQDYDICIAPDPQTIDQTLEIFHQCGFTLSEPVDATMIAQSVNIHLASEIDIDLLIQPKGFSFEVAWVRRTTIEEEGLKIHFVSRMDLISMKEASGRPQDQLDIQYLKASLGSMTNAELTAAKNKGRP